MIVSKSYAEQLMFDVTRAVWIEENSNALHDFFHPDARIHGVMPDETLTVEDYRVMVEQFSLLLQVTDIRISDCVCSPQGEVAYRMELDMVSRANGAKAPQEFANFCRFRGDKVAQSVVLTDQFSFFERAGLAEPSMRLQLLAG